MHLRDIACKEIIALGSLNKGLLMSSPDGQSLLPASWKSSQFTMKDVKLAPKLSLGDLGNGLDTGYLWALLAGSASTVLAALKPH